MQTRNFDPFRREPHPEDPVLTEAQVLALVRQHLTNAVAITGIDESGGEARTYFIDDDYLVKTQRPQKLRPSTSLEKETFHLRQIAQDAPEASVPRVLGYGRDGSIEYILMTRMPGVATRYLAFEGEARRAALFELGRTLRQIHSVDLDAFEASELFPGDTDAASVHQRIEGALRRAAEAIEAEPGNWNLEISPGDLATSALAGVAGDDRAPLHSNPGPEHVFVHPESLEFQGIIDFGDAYVSHPAFDMRRWSAPADRAAVLAGYRAEGEVSDGFLGTWRAVMIGGLMSAIAAIGPGAQRPERRQQALNDLPTFLSEL